MRRWAARCAGACCCCWRCRWRWCWPGWRSRGCSSATSRSSSTCAAGPADVALLAALEPDADGSGAGGGRWPTRAGSALAAACARQVQAVGRAEAEPALRSRSLWDERLPLADDTLPDGALHRHALPGPAGQRWRWSAPSSGAIYGPRWRVVVAADTRELEQALGAFDGALARSLAGWRGAAGGGGGAAGWACGRCARCSRRCRRCAHRPPRRGCRAFAPRCSRWWTTSTACWRTTSRAWSARRPAGTLAHAIKTLLAVIAHAGRGVAAARAGPRHRAAGAGAAPARTGGSAPAPRAPPVLPTRRGPTPVQPVLEGCCA